MRSVTVKLGLNFTTTGPLVSITTVAGNKTLRCLRFKMLSTRIKLVTRLQDLMIRRIMSGQLTYIFPNSTSKAIQR